MVSGHAAPDDPRSTVDWAALARGGTTIVVLMGVETLPHIVGALLDAGRHGDTPLACVMDGGLPTQQVVRQHPGPGRQRRPAAGPAVAGGDGDRGGRRLRGRLSCRWLQ